MSAVPRRRVLGLVLVGSALFTTSSCGKDADRPGLTGTLTVFAAASLTEAFTTLGRAFESAHPGLHVAFNFGASSSLSQQVLDGAPADVFVSADESNMAKLTAAHAVGGPSVIARNRLSILVEKGNPKAIHGLGDLARPDVVLVVCAPEVPCGKLAAAALRKATVDAKPASLEENVKGVVAKVTLGEADAGIVYVTDVRAASAKAAGVPIGIAGDPSLEAIYPMAVSSKAANPAAARAWVDYVRSVPGQRTLARFGFGPP